MKTKHEQEMLAQYQEYLEQDPDNTKLILAVSECHLNLGEIFEAEDIIEVALANHPQHPELLFQLATIKLMTDEATVAIRLLQQLKTIGIKHASIEYNLAYAYFYQEDYISAWEILEKFMKTAGATEIPESALLSARVLHHLAKLSDAIEILLPYTKQNEDTETLGYLSILYFDNLQTDKAIATAKKALSIDPTQPEARLILATVELDENHYPEALETFSHLIEENPKNGRAFNGRGIAKMLDLDIPGAIDDFTKAEELLPVFSGSYQALGWCQLINNDIEGAKKTFSECLNVSRNFAESHASLAVIDVIENRLDDAEKNIQHALRLDKNSFCGQFAQGLLLTQQAETEKGQAQTKALLEKIQTEFHKNINSMVKTLIEKKSNE